MRTGCALRDGSPDTARWISAAQPRASMALGKATISPSPRFLTSAPRQRPTASRSSSKWARRTTCPASSPNRPRLAVESTKSVKSSATMACPGAPPALPTCSCGLGRLIHPLRSRAGAPSSRARRSPGPRGPVATRAPRGSTKVDPRGSVKGAARAHGVDETGWRGPRRGPATVRRYEGVVVELPCAPEPCAPEPGQPEPIPGQSPDPGSFGAVRGAGVVVPGVVCCT